MNNKILEINKANKNNKKFKKNNSITDKKLTVLDSDISRLYKKYSIAKKERLNQEKEQKTKTFHKIYIILIILYFNII